MILGSLDQESFSLIGRSKMINYWQRNSKFCGACGKKTDFISSEEAFQCSCNNEFIYPKISPCIITLIIEAMRFCLEEVSIFQKGCLAH
jgi:NAD+ diphosphatase